MALKSPFGLTESEKRQEEHSNIRSGKALGATGKLLDRASD
jgi:hypothetical protein